MTGKKLLTLLFLLTSFVQAEHKPAFQVGEELKFRIRWGGMTGGYSTLTVPQITSLDGQRAYHIVSEARSSGFIDTFYKVRDYNQAWLDVNQPRSLGYEKNLREGKYQVNESVRYDYANNRFIRDKERLDKNTRKTQEGPLPSNVFDVLGSFYHVRSLPLEVGQSVTIDVQSGDKIWPLVVDVKKRAVAKTKAGKFDCFVLEPKLREPGIFIHKGKKLEIWVTADARRLPVLMRCEIAIGTISAELISATLGHADLAAVPTHSIPTN